MDPTHAPEARPALAAVVLAAGKGTRMKSDRAKVLHPICGRPLVWFPVREALKVGAAPVVVVVGHQGDAVADALGALFPDAPLQRVTQHEQRGTGHAVLAAREALEAAAAERVLILSGDVPLLTTATLERLVEASRAGGLSLLTTEPPDPTGYGRVIREAGGRVTAIVEHKDATEAQRALPEVNAGVYCVETALLLEALGTLTTDNAQGELYLTDMVAFAAKQGRTVAAVQVADPMEVAGVNDRAELARAGAVLRARINEALMKSGVSIEDPQATYVDAGVEIGPDSVLEPGVRLAGRTRLGAGVQVGAYTVMVDADVADGAVIRPHSSLEDARVGAGAIVGPFARLRPGAVLDEDVHVGNFVEVKKARLHKGAKANHLTYLGDAEVGAGSNIGAGTITCNYDGVNKHRTEIGERCFIGSNTALVAPIAVGSGAYVAAGSILTKDVPEGALGVARGSQRNIEGWVARKAPKREKR